jgi:UDP-N-acetylmuramyl pentapeptide phosphotransferase/UDP-N-acetylglucosamine-1-phosphate transferase
VRRSLFIRLKKIPTGIFKRKDAMMLFAYPIAIPVFSGVLSALGTWALLPILKRHAMDVPNARSNHKNPVPRGGGIAMIAAALVGLVIAGLPLLIAVAAVGLAALSFIDDLRGLRVSLRLGAQAVAVALALSCMQGRILPDFIPHSLEYVFLGLLWIWFINLTNFMDGIDGISAMQAIMVSAGIGVIRTICPWLPPFFAVEAGVMAAAAYGFYLFNRSPARLFMGDAGSIPLGFLMGYLLLELAAYGYPLPALILPAYYLTDATFTLIKRQLRGEWIWQAHSEHAYQQAVRRGFTHPQVVARISWLNSGLIALAMCGTVSMMAGILSLVAAYGITFWLIYHFTHATPA